MRNDGGGVCFGFDSFYTKGCVCLFAICSFLAIIIVLFYGKILYINVCLRIDSAFLFTNFCILNKYIYLCSPIESRGRFVYFDKRCAAVLIDALMFFM